MAVYHRKLIDGECCVPRPPLVQAGCRCMGVLPNWEWEEGNENEDICIQNLINHSVESVILHISRRQEVILTVHIT